MFVGDGKDKTVVTGYRSVVAGSPLILIQVVNDHDCSGDRSRTDNEGHDNRELGRPGEPPGGGAPGQSGLRGGVPLQHNRLPGHALRALAEAILPRVQRVRDRRLRVRQRGRGAAVVQPPMAVQKNTITAQNRKDPNQNTGISIHDCRILAVPDLEAEKWAYPTYLGRPWKAYSRTVYRMSYMGDHVDAAGWLEWNGGFALDTLYYGEYMDFGPGAGVAKMVAWPGYRVMELAEEASKFTVSKFIHGYSWLPSTGVAFLAGLSA